MPEGKKTLGERKVYPHYFVAPVCARQLDGPVDQHPVTRHLQQKTHQLVNHTFNTFITHETRPNAKPFGKAGVGTS